jgi:hypothetical protein
MPKLNQVAVVPVEWNKHANRYVSNSDSTFSEVYNRLRPVLDPMVVTMGPLARPGGKYPWEGNDQKTGVRYVARKHRELDTVSLEEVLDA